MNIKFGDVLLADFGKNNGSIQGGCRPCVVIQNDIGNLYSPTLIVVPLTTEMKKLNMPNHRILYRSTCNGLKRDSMVLGEQICVINKDVVKDKLGRVTEKEWNVVESAFKASFPKTLNA